MISNVSQDTLDYSGPKVNEGSKGIWLALGPAKRTLKSEILGELPQGVSAAKVFVPGCIVVSGPSYEKEPGFAKRIVSHAGFANFELILLVDDVAECVSSTEKFLWTWFTRFEPANDILASHMENVRFHTQLKAPLLFDSRMKPWYPGVVEPAPETVKLVDKRWGEYFPGGNWKN